MTNQIVLFIAFLKSFLLVNKTEGFNAGGLGDKCESDNQCHQKDPNSHCLTLDENLRCACKLNYHVDVVNNTEKCIYSEPIEEEKEGLTAAPIILCFMGCVVVEALCLLAFRYWNKHRRTGFTRHGTLQLQAISLTDARFTHGQRGPVISFMITHEMESVISQGAGSSSPPPYSQMAECSTSVTLQAEEPPPPYEEAVKQCSTSKLTSDEESNRRKMSC
ncbi:uncharacterized protein LOC129219235 [Uloborus diversus]|uniref:uncharacterized protein LOC129219235 n=1 Tax=Uloborus diversus TaxID=327109 RepID=UPI00240A0F24|nr:uncharacterized protein LOC129219235 [Uloborus diversus]